jgi:hypothetical protein
MEGSRFIPTDALTGAGYVMDDAYTPGTHPNLNDGMTREQREAFTAHMRGEKVGFAADGTPYIVNQAMSVQTVEEALRLRRERETNLGS